MQLTLNGLAVGCIYGLVALGFVLIYKATELVNFAQGDLLMLGAFVAYMAIVLWGLDYWVGFLIAIVVIAVFGVLFRLEIKTGAPAGTNNDPACTVSCALS